MIRRLIAVLAFVLMLPAAALADDPRGTADDALAGTWKLTWNLVPFAGPTTGGHYVQVYSDRRVHWTDSVRDMFVRGRPVLDASARCEDSTQLNADDFAAMRDVARAIYDIQLQDRSFGAGVSFLELTVTREGRDYIAGIVHYPPALENLDPRLKRAQAIFARFACPSPSPPARPPS